ncbi:reverse transcriptase domain-containing protein [Tanacetum coccineum]
MLAIFHDMIEESIEVFMDDFSVFGNSFDKCLNNLDKMLQCCKDAHLVLNWEKCHFMVKEGIVLGHKVSGVGLEVKKVKIDVISKLPPPTNIKGVRSFLGHAGFYRRFIKDFLKIARPLTKLLEKVTLFEFNDECQKAFELLKEKLTWAPLIVNPNWNLPFKLMCDASDFVVGAVLGGHKDQASACLCHMLYCIEASSPYNLAFFILKRMEKTRNKPKELLPCGILLTRLFKHVVAVSPELAFDHYLSHDRAMYLLAPHYERKTRSDHGKKRPRESNASSSSTTQNHPSSSLPLDAIVDEINDESFQSNSSSSSNDVSSSSNVVHRVRQNPPYESHNLNTYFSEKINIQTQQPEAHWEGLRSIGQPIKNMMSGKRK